MSWYEIKITPEHKTDYIRGGRVLLVWDDRSKEAIADELAAKSSVALWRAAFSTDKTRLEDRGTIVIFAGHMISIEDRLDYNNLFPKGPTERQPY